MPTSGVAGKLMSLQIEGNALAEARDFTLNYGQEEIDLTSKDSGWWKESKPGLRDWAITGTGLYIYNDWARRLLDLHYHDRSPDFLDIILTMAYAEGGSANVTKEGKCYITSISFTGPYGGAAEASFTLRGTHELEITAS